MKHFSNSLNIIYLCTTEKGPSGGAKVIYNHSDLINELKIKNINSEVLHIKKKKTSKWSSSIKKILKIPSRDYSGWGVKDITVAKNFKYKWFKSKIKIKKDLVFYKNIDFLIFPEIFAHFAQKLCINNKIPYGIFVQNGYCLNSTNDYKTLNTVYEKAKFIISTTNNISKYIKLAFPNCDEKILKINLSIDKNKFNFNTKKINMITYMPRKLATHSSNLVFFLRKKIPKSWKFKALHNLNENDVYKNLSKSKIFLSFSMMEGLGLPPIEAAIAGNKVIGYSGEGGKEYWKKPIFTEIPHGNISKFIDEILIHIKKKNMKKNFKSSIKKITTKFSVIQEKKNIIKMINKIKPLT